MVAKLFSCREINRGAPDEVACVAGGIDCWSRSSWCLVALSGVMVSSLRGCLRPAQTISVSAAVGSDESASSLFAMQPVVPALFIRFSSFKTPSAASSLDLHVRSSHESFEKSTARTKDEVPSEERPRHHDRSCTRNCVQSCGVLFDGCTSNFELWSGLLLFILSLCRNTRECVREGASSDG